MMPKTFVGPAAAFVCLLSVSASHAQTLETREEPEAGKEEIASVGSRMWEERQFAGIPGVVTEAGVDARWGGLEHVELPSGSALIVRREKKLKACQSKTTFSNIGASIWSNCLIDEGDDGTFDKVSYSDGGLAQRLIPAVPYTRQVVEATGGDAPSFRKVLLYTGSDRSTIKFSYREFSNDMARPAFTEELTVPLETTYPQEIEVKGKVFRILNINGRGVTFSLIQ